MTEQKPDLLSDEDDGHYFTKRQEWLFVRLLIVGTAIAVVAAFIHGW